MHLFLEWRIFLILNYYVRSLILIGRCHCMGMSEALIWRIILLCIYQVNLMKMSLYGYVRGTRMKNHITVHIPGKSDRKMSLYGYITVHIPWPILMVFLSFLQQKSLKPDIGIAFPSVVVTVLTPSSFCGYISFSITIQHRFTILGPHIDNDVYISARHVPHDLDLIFMVYWLLNLHQVFMIRSVSLNIQPRSHIDQGGYMSA